MENKYKKIDTLAIIGNGFDLAHGYNTTFKCFVESMNKKNFSEYFEFLIKKCINIDKWFDFENRIFDLTENLYGESISSLSKDIDEEYRKFNNIINSIKSLLMIYLSDETSKNKLIKKKSIEDVISENTIALNFNYTKTAEKYFSDIIYVHGSIEEKDIILGYDKPDPFCLATFDCTKWNKFCERERLAFNRYIRKKYNKNLEECNELYEAFFNYQWTKYSGRGLDDDYLKSIKYVEIYPEFYNMYFGNTLYGLENVPFSDIKKIIVLGHGIESDKEFLSSIVGLCGNVVEVIIFTYDGEKNSDLNNKINFFKNYCNIVKIKGYDI